MVIISLVCGDNVVAAGMADRREAMPTQRPGAKRRAEGKGEKFYCEALAEQWDFSPSLSERPRSHNVRKFQNKMQGRCLKESFELHFILGFPPLAGKLYRSQEMSTRIIQRVSAKGSHPTAASIQEIDCRSKEVYIYTSLLRQWFSVWGAKEVKLAKPPWELGRGARQRRRGGNGTQR